MKRRTHFCCSLLLFSAALQALIEEPRPQLADLTQHMEAAITTINKNLQEAYEAAPPRPSGPERAIAPAQLTITAFSIQKLAAALQNFAIKIVEPSAARVTEKLHETFARLPEVIVGLPIMLTNVLRQPIINALHRSVDDITPLEQLRSTISILRACLAAPQQAVALLEKIIESSPSIPQAVRTTLNTALATIKSMLASTEWEDVAGVKAVTALCSAALDFVEQLYHNRERLDTLRLDIARTAFDGALNEQIGSIDTLITRAMPALQEIIATSNTIRNNDLRGLDARIFVDLKNSALVA